MRWLVLLTCGVLSKAAHSAETFEDWTYYTGDPHVHSGLSQDGGSSDYGVCKGSCGSFYSIFEDGRARGLDWMAVSDHSNGDFGHPTSDEEGYAELTAMALEAHAPEEGFVTLPAAEVWARARVTGDIGHVTLLMFGENEELADLSMSDLQPSGSTATLLNTCEDFGEWMQGVADTYGPALMIPHHPAALRPMAADWTCHFEEFQPAVEVYSEHGQSLTDEDSGFDPMWSTAVSDGTVHYAMDPDGLALKLGFMAGSDGHDTRPGNICRRDTVHISHPYGGGHTVVVLDSGESFDRQTVYEAIVDHRTYATTGPSVPLVVEYSTGGVIVADLGGDAGVPTDQDLDVEVRMPGDWANYIVGVGLVTPDETFAMEHTEEASWTYTFAFDELPAWMYVAVEIDGEAYYGEDGCTDGGPDEAEWIWVSPSWVSEVDPDLDGDGVAYLEGDCDDGDSSVSPLESETWYDGIDQDCLGDDDYDQDKDGYALEDDCDDTDASLNPSAEETWYDGVDQDCDGSDEDQDGDGFSFAEDCDDTDTSLSPAETEIWYDGIDQDCDGNDDDQDGDGYSVSDDCDDTFAGINPGETENWYDGIDQDCDGEDDDQDQDGFLLADDCDDTDDSVNPDQGEVWYDGIDQDCDGSDDDQDQDGFVLAEDCDDTDDSVNPDQPEVWYDDTDQDCDGNDEDQDKDGFALADDCDDINDRINPVSVEVWYDGIDQDCDGNDDDQDADGYALSEDCDDTNLRINPGQAETWYDGADQDCDGNDDDQDKDGYNLAEDCDDTDAEVNPGWTEIWYDGTDQDCDGSDDDQDKDGFILSDDCDDVNAEVNPGKLEVWYDGTDQDCDGNDDDQDRDGYALGEDCDDTNWRINPGAAETWYDGADQDCDGNDDDQDKDGYNLAEDCVDTDAGIHPGAFEICSDALDQDCDGADTPCTYTDDGGDPGSFHPGMESVEPGPREEPGEGGQNSTWEVVDSGEQIGANLDDPVGEGGAGPGPGGPPGGELDPGLDPKSGAGCVGCASASRGSGLALALAALLLPLRRRAPRRVSARSRG